MGENEIRETVEKILQETFPKASLAQPFDAIEGMDSLDYVCFITDVEAKFDVKIPRDLAAKLDRPEDLCEWLRSELQGGSNVDAIIAAGRRH